VVGVFGGDVSVTSIGERASRNKSEEAVVRNVCVLVTIAVISVLPTSALGQWIEQESGTKARLRGVSVVDRQLVWASGTDRTIVRTEDGGQTWRNVSLPEQEGADLDVRDIQAFGKDHAFALTIGPGEKSRVYETTDGGVSWRRSYMNQDPDGFLDALSFWDEKRGLVLGDPVGGRFAVRRTKDGGQTWDRVGADGMPPSRPGEGAFAASGTCLVVRPGGMVWFGTGGAEKTRVFRSDDFGETWTVHETPVKAGGPAAGIFSLDFFTDRLGVAAGGDYQRPDAVDHNLALTDDGGKTWRLRAEADGPDVTGYRSAVVFLEMDVFQHGRSLIAAGPNGTDMSEDGGMTWKRVSDRGLDALGGRSREALWGVGDGGTVVRWQTRR
jgi:photosystem II stability/assembly factor-like uncharacterized protein